MSDRSSVAGAVFSKIRGFSVVSGDKNADQDTHKMIYDPVRIELLLFTGSIPRGVLP